MSTRTGDLPETRTLPVTEIRPYPNNPRRIPEEAVRAVAESIEKYGYQQPIVVDKDNVVIVGHTRLKALEHLGIETAEVYVADLSEEQAKRYRLVDNRTGEMTDWDHAQLVLELREWEEGLLDRWFPEIDLEVDSINSALDEVNETDVEKATNSITDVKQPPKIITTVVQCPACQDEFEVQTDSLPGVSKEDLAVLSEVVGDGEAQ